MHSPIPRDVPVMIAVYPASLLIQGVPGVVIEIFYPLAINSLER